MSKFNSKKKYEKTQVSGGSGEDIRRMKLEVGLNVIRIAEDNFEDAWVHYFEGADKKTKRAVCLGKGKCPLCEKGEKAKHRFFFNVIDRKEQKATEETKIKLLEVGKMIYEQIRDLAGDDEYGDPTQYNLKIKRTGAKLTTKYSVVASTKVYDLKKSEKKAAELDTEEGGAYDLSYFINKITKAEMIKLMSGEQEGADVDEEDDDSDEDSKPNKKNKKGGRKVKDNEDNDEDNEEEDEGGEKDDDGEDDDKKDEDSEELDLDKELKELDEDEDDDEPAKKKSKKKKVDDDDDDDDEPAKKKGKGKKKKDADEDEDEEW